MPSTRKTDYRIDFEKELLDYEKTQLIRQFDTIYRMPFLEMIKSYIAMTSSKDALGSVTDFQSAIWYRIDWRTPEEDNIAKAYLDEMLKTSTTATPLAVVLRAKLNLSTNCTTIKSFEGPEELSKNYHYPRFVKRFQTSKQEESYYAIALAHFDTVNVYEKWIIYIYV